MRINYIDWITNQKLVLESLKLNQQFTIAKTWKQPVSISGYMDREEVYV